MFILKIKFLAVLVIVTIIGFVAYKAGLYELMKRSWSRPERATITSELVAMKEINRFYTSIYMVPILDISYGTLKRDKLKEFAPSFLGLEKSKQVPKGYYLQKYEVGFGYDNLLGLLQDDVFMARVCSGDSSVLQNPSILAVNRMSVKEEGSYDGNYNELDKNPALRMSIINQELGKSDALNTINEQGKKSLHSMLSVFCQ